MDKRETLKLELQAIIGDEAKPERLRNFFRPTGDLEELVIKCILWGHYFWPKYFSKPTPEFHYDLVRIFFQKGFPEISDFFAKKLNWSFSTGALRKSKPNFSSTKVSRRSLRPTDRYGITLLVRSQIVFTENLPVRGALYHYNRPSRQP